MTAKEKRRVPAGARILATCCFLGYVRPASGSVASILGVVLYLVLAPLSVMIYGATLVCLFFFGVWASRVVEDRLGEKDPSVVVIDEVVGMMITLIGLPADFPVLVTAFFLFRAFDMFKVYPANRMENTAGGRGIMLDDVVAGLYANIVMQAALFLKAGMF